MSASFSKDDTLIITSEKNSSKHADDWSCIRAWRAVDGAPLSAVKGAKVLRETPLGLRALDEDGVLWDLRSNAPIARLNDLKRFWSGAFISSDGKHIAIYDQTREGLLGDARGSTVGIWSRCRPEYWWGVAWLPEFWLTVVFGAAFVWSVLRDRRTLTSPGLTE